MLDLVYLREHLLEARDRRALRQVVEAQYLADGSDILTQNILPL